MTCFKCGCTVATCGCCAGTSSRTPADTANRPGLSALRYRVGVHGEFLESMKARLATMTVEAAGADGQTLQTFRPLAGLTTRDTSDPSIALLDVWAVLGDVLGFYQERVANEGYLRTATERRSVLELARLVGYALRPGVASTVYLAYVLDEKQTEPVEIPAGSRSQSIPGPGEVAQPFETAEALVAQAPWSDLKVRVSRPQSIGFDTILALEQLYVSGTSTGLKAGDKLLFEFDGEVYALRTVASITTDFDNARTLIALQPLAAGTAECAAKLDEFIAKATPLAGPGGTGADQSFLDEALAIRHNTLMGLHSPPQGWVEHMTRAVDGTISDEMQELADSLAEAIAEVLESLAPSVGSVTSPSKFVTSLLKPVVQQARSKAHLTRDLGQAFTAGSDTMPQLLVNFAPGLKTTYYAAWATADVSAALPALVALHAIRVTAPLFGSSVSRMATYVKRELDTPDNWKEWPLDATEASDRLNLDQLYESIAPGSLVVVQSDSGGLRTRKVFTVTAGEGGPRTAYGMSGKSTQLTLDAEWWFGVQDAMATLRSALVYGQTEELTIIDEPVTDDVGGQSIELADLQSALTSGRWVILSGERTDIEGVTGVEASELLMISGLDHGFDPALAGDKTHTTLLLATSTAYTYKRESVTLYGNVVKATHGETRLETLGSGDGSRALQTFGLKQPPLTWVSAPSVSGVESTLVVRVDDVEWHEASTLAGSAPTDRIFVTKTDDADLTSVIFGNGREGARLPTGVENVRAEYRSGIGAPGNVRAGQISLLQTKPLGVKSVVNPLAASGGADRESLDQARENAPLAVMALDRLVSLRDYEDFARTFAGVGKAAVKRLSDGLREIVHVTIAGAEDAAIDVTSDLYQNLLVALRRFGAPELAVQVDARELIALVLSARIRLLADHEWETVAEDVRTALLTAFGFARRSLGQSALLSEVIGVIQRVPGVAFVDVDVFGGVHEKVEATDAVTGIVERRLRTSDEIVAEVQDLLQQPADATESDGLPCGGGVRAQTASVSKGVVAPAELALFEAAVPDTLILNQIL